jgi:hypothetical protein
LVILVSYGLILLSQTQNIQSNIGIDNRPFYTIVEDSYIQPTPNLSTTLEPDNFPTPDPTLFFGMEG